MTKKDRFAGCILGGAIGDAWGSAFENLSFQNDANTFYLDGGRKTEPTWSITDDTQLTLITLEAIIQTDKLTPEVLANTFVKFHKRRKNN